MKALILASALLSFNVLAADPCLTCIGATAIQPTSPPVDNFNSSASRLPASEVYEITLTQKMTFEAPSCDGIKCIVPLTDSRLIIASNLQGSPKSNSKYSIVNVGFADINSLQYTNDNLAFVDNRGLEYQTTMEKKGIIPSKSFLQIAILPFNKNDPIVKILGESSIKYAQSSLKPASIDKNIFFKSSSCYGGFTENNIWKIECFIAIRTTATN